MLALLLLVGGRASADDIPSDKRALILLRILAYDRNVARRAGDTVRVAVLYKVGDEPSERAASDLVAAIAAAPHSVGGKPVRVLSLPYTADSVERDLERAGVVAVYVGLGLSGAVPRVAEATQRRTILSFAAEEPMVKNGLSIGVVRRGERVAILVNLITARAEGADLSSDLLRLADWVNR